MAGTRSAPFSACRQCASRSQKSAYDPDSDVQIFGILANSATTSVDVALVIPEIEDDHADEQPDLEARANQPARRQNGVRTAQAQRGSTLTKRNQRRHEAEEKEARGEENPERC